MNPELPPIRTDPWRARLAAGFSSLKLRITLAAVGALVIGTALTTALLVRQAEHDTLAAQRHRGLADTVRTAGALAQRVVTLQRALQATAARVDPSMLDDAARLAAFVDSQPVLRGMFASLYVAGADGRMRILADAAGVRRSDIDVSDRAYFRRTLAEQRAIVSEVLPSRVSGEPVIVFTYPLRSPAGVYGVLGGALRLASRDLLGDIENGADDSALLVVTDVQGRVLAHPDPRRLLSPLAAEPRLAQAFAQWVGAGSAVEPAGLHLEQRGELVSAGGVAGPDWMVWRALPRSELLAPLHAARAQALRWAGALIALVALAMLWLLHRLLRPLTELEHRAGHLFDSSHDPQLGWPVAGGEIGRLSRVLRHVGAERAQLEALNTQVLRKLGSVMSAAPVGICFTRERRFELVSAEFCRLFGRTEQALLGQPVHTIYASADDYHAVGMQVAQAFAAGQPYVGEWRMARADGTLFWGRLRGRPVAAGDASAGTIWTLNDIDAQVEARTRLEWSATHDILTGVANRKALDARLAAVFGALPRSLPAALVMIDLDHFKPINDGCGHAAGDAMLQAVAVAIAGCVRSADLVVRLGGDEFALLLERCPADVALRIAETARAAIEAIRLPWGAAPQLRVGASLGVAALAAETRDAAAWLHAADATCYRAKAEGRGVVRVATRPLLEPPRAAGARLPNDSV